MCVSCQKQKNNCTRLVVKYKAITIGRSFFTKRTNTNYKCNINTIPGNFLFIFAIMCCIILFKLYNNYAILAKAVRECCPTFVSQALNIKSIQIDTRISNQCKTM